MQSARRTISTSSWPTPTVSIEHELLSCGIQNQRDIARRARQAAKKSARRHRANKNARVARVALHADAIAQNRAARVRTRRIDGDNPNVISLPWR